MSVNSYEELRAHIGHSVEVVCYGKKGFAPANVAIECMDCCEILMNFDRPAPELKKKKASVQRHKTCEDCGEEFLLTEGRPYKYEPAIWLCDGCHDARMEEDEDDEE